MSVASEQDSSVVSDGCRLLDNHLYQLIQFDRDDSERIVREKSKLEESVDGQSLAAGWERENSFLRRGIANYTIDDALQVCCIGLIYGVWAYLWCLGFFVVHDFTCDAWAYLWCFAKCKRTFTAKGDLRRVRFIRLSDRITFR
jgi:hypothetical protein